MCKITGTLQNLGGGKNKAKQEKIKELLQIGGDYEDMKTMFNVRFWIFLSIEGHQSKTSKI